jgi:hypothetical protein
VIAALLAVLALSAPPAPAGYAFEQGSKVTLHATVAQTATETMGPDTTRSVLPEVALDLELTVTSVAAGRATLNVRASRITVTPRPGTEKGAASALQKGFDDGSPLSFVVTVGPDGRADAKVAEGVKASASTAETVQMIVEALRGLWPDLPPEPALKGASWTVPSTRSDGGLRFTTSTVVTRQNADGQPLTLAFVRTETLDAPSPVPGTPKGVTAQFAAASTKTEGTVTLGPNALPRHAQANGRGTLTMAGKAGGKAFTMLLGEERTVRLDASGPTAH